MSTTETYHTQGKRRERVIPMSIPTERDHDLALRDVSEMGFNLATRWSQYVIEWFEDRHSYATKRAWLRILQAN